MTMTGLVPLGDRGFLVSFADEAGAARWAEEVRRRNWPGVVDVVAAYQTVGVFADPGSTGLDELRARLAQVEIPIEQAEVGRIHEIPVVYDGLDLGEVSARLGVHAGAVSEAHSGTDYHVFAIGFLPGFPYAGYLPEALRGLPRRESPRKKVPAGSVAIVGKQTAIYPSESPGGWHVIGRTPLRIVDAADGYFPIRAGDRLRFRPIDSDEYAARQGERL
jgi:KipI family sensor histidine kinase inhibitor